MENTLKQVIEIEDTRRRRKSFCLFLRARSARNGEKMKNSFLMIMRLSYLQDI